MAGMSQSRSGLTEDEIKMYDWLYDKKKPEKVTHWQLNCFTYYAAFEL
jgi:hypothetical protein